MIPSSTTFYEDEYQQFFLTGVNTCHSIQRDHIFPAQKQFNSFNRNFIWAKYFDKNFKAPIVENRQSIYKDKEC